MPPGPATTSSSDPYRSTARWRNSSPMKGSSGRGCCSQAGPHPSSFFRSFLRIRFERFSRPFRTLLCTLVAAALYSYRKFRSCLFNFRGRPRGDASRLHELPSLLQPAARVCSACSPTDMAPEQYMLGRAPYTCRASFAMRLPSLLRHLGIQPSEVACIGNPARPPGAALKLTRVFQQRLSSPADPAGRLTVTAPGRRSTACGGTPAPRRHLLAFAAHALECYDRPPSSSL